MAADVTGKDTCAGEHQHLVASIEAADAARFVIILRDTCQGKKL